VILLLGTVWQSAAAADDDVAAAREHYRKATNAFELGNFDEAIREYEQAYKLKDDPAILYNLGQAHRLAQHPSEALHFYKMYLSKVPNAQNRAEVESKITALQQLVDQQRAATAMPPTAPMRATPTPETAPAAGGPAAAEKPAPPPKPGFAMKVSGIAVGVAGVGLVAAGVAFGVLAKNAGDDLTHQAQMGTFDYAKQQDGKRDQMLEGVFLGIGAAAVAAGTVLYVLGHRAARRAASNETALQLAPVAGRDRAGATVTLRF
jgi:tetratricopeptide (TPR) repeat protein